MRRVSCAILAAAAFSGVVRAQAQAPKPADIVLANPSVSIALGASYIAEELGFFAKHGLNVKVVVIPGAGATNAVISGGADFTEASSTSINRAAARGQR